MKVCKDRDAMDYCLAGLRAKAAECRLRAVESQLALGLTLCAMAETQIHYGRLDEASNAMNKLRYHAENFRFHIAEPNHFPSAAIPHLRMQLTQLTKRIEAVESCLRQW